MMEVADMGAAADELAEAGGSSWVREVMVVEQQDGIFPHGDLSSPGVATLLLVLQLRQSSCWQWITSSLHGLCARALDLMVLCMIF